VVDQRAACTAPEALDRHFAEFDLVGVELALALEAQPVAVGGEVVEAVVVHADVRHVRGHAIDGEFRGGVGETLFAGGVELQEAGAVVETFRPLGPAARGIFAGVGEDGRTLRGIVGVEDRVDLLAGQLPEALQGGSEVFSGELGVDAHGEGAISNKR
jgi:hypothetical protein